MNSCGAAAAAAAGSPTRRRQRPRPVGPSCLVALALLLGLLVAVSSSPQARAQQVHDRATCAATNDQGECLAPPQQQEQETGSSSTTTTTTHHAPGQRTVDVGARPRTPKLGEVVGNLKEKVPAELPGWAARVWATVGPTVAKLRAAAAPQVQKLVQYGGEVLKPGEEVVERCRNRRKTAGATGNGGKEVEAAANGGGLDACALLDVSWSLGRQLAGAGKNASAAAGAWLATEVPRVPIPLHLVWVDLDVEVQPVTAQDVGSLILHQRPFWVVRLADWLSERLARFLHAVPLMDLAINARYDLFYWPDPACPLTTTDGLVVRAPLTADGYCEVRPCAAQSTIAGQAPAASPFCECDLPRRRCRLRAEPLRDFQLLVDAPLAGKPFDAQCTTSVAWASIPDWLPLPPQARLALQGVLPLYLVNLLAGILLLYLAEPLSECRAVHLLLGAFLGLFSVLILVALALNHALRTVKRLQPFSGVATLLSSAATVLLFQRFGRESPFLLVRQVLAALWADPKGQWLVLGSAAFGVLLTLALGWFTESEEEAQARPGWLRPAFNGQANIRRGLRLGGLFALLHSCPNPDYGALVVALFLASDHLAYLGRRLHMFLHRSPDTRRFLARPRPDEEAYHHHAVVGDEGAGAAAGLRRRGRSAVGGKAAGAGAEEMDEYTRRQLEALRGYVNANPAAAHKVQRGANDLRRFREGGPDAVVDQADVEEMDAAGRGGRCAVQ